MLLAIDTASRLMSAALLDEGGLLAEQTIFSNNQHTVQLTEMIRQLLAQLERPIHDLRVLAVAQGPGSFTGLRVGFGVAKGLASACGLPLIAVPTLDIIAAGTPCFD